MKPTRVGDDWARFDDGTCWALPDVHDDEHDHHGWVLRYGSAEQVEKRRLSIASALDCYAALIDLPQRQRNARAKAIREAMAMRDAATRTHTSSSEGGALTRSKGRKRA